MLNDTRLKYDAYTTQIGKLNGVADTGKSFTVAPTVAQTLRGKIQASSAFLTSINIIPVVAQEGSWLRVAMTAPSLPTSTNRAAWTNSTA